MTRFMLAAGVAALAITAPALSKPGNGNGNGNGGGNGHGAAQHERGGGKAFERGNGGGKAFDRGGEARRDFVEQRGNGRDKAFERRNKQIEKMAEQRSKGREKAFERRNERLEKFAEQRSKAREKAFERQEKFAEKARERREKQIERLSERRSDRLERIAENRNAFRDRDFDRDDVIAANALGFGVGGCPPGLAKKPVACMPPGQARKFVGQRVDSLARAAALSELPVRLRSIYPDTDDYYYRYGDGYLYRVDRQSQLVNSLLPLFGLGYGVGQPFPTAYSGFGMPTAFQPFYPDTPYSSYRYADGYMYQVDPFTGLIQDVDPMLGYGYGYGQMLPATYSAYNVPYEYRPLYYDTSDAYYRYAPGAIYQVDPTTSLITGVAALLAPGLNIGQALPMGYSAYNVPYDYRSQYYDTSDAWYRYANGNIYRVDPTTQLVTALVASILT